MLETSVQFLKGVGPKKVLAYQKLGIFTLSDLLAHYPRSYEDRTRILPIAQLPLGEAACFVATVAAPVRMAHITGGRQLARTTLADDTGMVSASFFNQPYIKNSLKEGARYLFYGKIGGTKLRREIVSPEYRLLRPGEEHSPHLGEILPVYSLCEGLNQKEMRRQTAQALELCGGELREYLPPWVVQEQQLSDYARAVHDIHRPPHFESLQRAKQRLCFDELFLLSAAMLRMKERRQEMHTERYLTDTDITPFLQALPYALTGAQNRCIHEILKDMSRPVPMNRLVQGDVGCGKTMVAFAALYAAAKNGLQSTMMAPTEILARQHFDNLQRISPALGLRTALLTGSMSKKQKEQIKEEIRTGQVDVVVGTHALIQQDVEFPALALAVTDEQHRFGVEQRSDLADKGGTPHILVMSATPIPRSLSFVIYGDLDLSVIDELPPGRQQVSTHIVNERRRADLYQFIRKEVCAGRQAYFVCPLVEESEKMDLQSVLEFTHTLQEQVFPDLRVGCVHGRMKQREKDAVMGAFSAGMLDILVSTTVIEVGVDVPNASVMVVEDAVRFGLSQLHQLRGRVGRGSDQAYCFLMADHPGETGRKRLNILKNTNDGFVISKEDLHLRGPGDFFGRRQHGLPQLKIADLFSDAQTVAQARDCAQRLLERDPDLSLPEHQGILQRCHAMLHAMEQTNTFN